MNSKNEKQFHKIWRIVRNVLQRPKTMAKGINYQLSDEPFILSSSNVLIGVVNPPPPSNIFEIARKLVRKSAMLQSSCS